MTGAPPVWRPKYNPWLIGVAVAMAAFMEVLDTSIANVALPYMAGSLGATNDQSTWVLTSYLVSNAIVLPVSGWFAGAVGRKRFFMLCLMIFTTSSVLCGIAPSLSAIILFRVMQGAGGGGLQPMAQAILADTFPPEKRGLAFSLYGITAIIAPAIGPTLGGWITDNYSWRWIFFINLPVGIFTLLLIFRLIEDPPWIKRTGDAGIKFDYIGFGLLALGVGALQVMLDKGQEDDWFGSHFILTLAILASVGLISCVLWEWFHKQPIIDVRMFQNLNFLGACGMMFVLGILLFASLVMMPLFLQSLLGYTAESAGLVLSGGSVMLLFLMPISGVLVSKVHARYIIAFGWLTLSIAMYYSTQNLDLQISFKSASLLRLAQVFGLAFLFVPINLVSYIGMPTEKSNSVSGLVNFMRNIGSSIGTSMVTTLIARRAQFHQVYLAADITPAHPQLTRAAGALTTRLATVGLSETRAASQAYARVYAELIGQATTLAYIDTFRILAIGAGIMFLLSFALKKNQPGAGGGGVEGAPLANEQAAPAPAESAAAVSEAAAGHEEPAVKRSGGMPIRIVTVEREYGSGGGDIAALLAERLQWKLWDQLLTEEIARRLECDCRAVERHEERRDPAYYRLLKSFTRGSFEGSVNAPRLKTVDTECVREVVGQILPEIAAAGECVIVGRGSAYYLGNRPDAFHVFVYAPFDERVRRLQATGKSESEAAELAETVDRDRAAFIKEYFHVDWPERHRFHLMVNSGMGEEAAVEIILDALARYAERRS